MAGDWNAGGSCSSCPRIMHSQIIIKPFSPKNISYGYVFLGPWSPDAEEPHHRVEQEAAEGTGEQAFWENRCCRRILCFSGGPKADLSCGSWEETAH